MLGKKIKLMVLFILGFGLTGLQAQEAVTGSGGEASGSGGTVSFSVGQVVYTTNNGVGGSVAQGVQQPYEISVITAIDQNMEINLACSAFPNPTADYLILKVDQVENQNLSYTLYDIHGKALQDSQIKNMETKISMVNFSPSTYFLKVTNNKKEVKTFKIIKN